MLADKGSSFLIFDRKDKSGVFRYEKIINLPQFQEGKDYTVDGSIYIILSPQLRREILISQSSLNDNINLSGLEIRVLVDNERVFGNSFREGDNLLKYAFAMDAEKQGKHEEAERLWKQLKKEKQETERNRYSPFGFLCDIKHYPPTQKELNNIKNTKNKEQDTYSLSQVKQSIPWIIIGGIFLVLYFCKRFRKKKRL